MPRPSKPTSVLEADATGSVAIHLPRDIDTLRITAAQSVTELLPPGSSAGIVLFDGDRVGSVELTVGDCPWT
ncbi:MAG: hypothetical protein KDB80_00295, partial [Planctomycetes bacterium]|nr:hypothetical protein [Planctomycetota bacterium]